MIRGRVKRSRRVNRKDREEEQRSQQRDKIQSRSNRRPAAARPPLWEVQPQPPRGHPGREDGDGHHAPAGEQAQPRQDAHQQAQRRQAEHQREHWCRRTSQDSPPQWIAKSQAEKQHSPRRSVRDQPQMNDGEQAAETIPLLPPIRPAEIPIWMSGRVRMTSPRGVDLVAHPAPVSSSTQLESTTRRRHIHRARSWPDSSIPLTALHPPPGVVAEHRASWPVAAV